MTYKQVSCDLIKSWFKNYFLAIFSTVFPFIVSLILLLANKNSFLSAASNGFAVMSLYILTTCGLCLPIFIFNIKKNQWFKNKYGLYINSWKLTYFIAIYAFVYSILLATIGFVLWLMLFAILSSANYYSLDSMNNFKSWIEKIQFINWIEILFYYGYESILGIAIAFALNAFIKKTWIIYFVTAIIMGYNFFFIGTLDYIHFFSNATSGYKIFEGFSYLAIYSYTSVNGWLSLIGIGSFDFVLNVSLQNGEYGTINISHIATLMNFTIPFILISIAITLSSMKFRWWRDINQNYISNETSIKLISKSTFIINFVWIGLSLIFVIIGIACTIAGNIQFKHSIDDFYKNNDKLVKDSKYISGVFFLVLGIINLSCSAGYLMKNIYANIENGLQKHITNIYQSN